MKQSALLAAAYALFLTSSVLSLFFGESGVAASQRLGEQLDALAGNLAVLEEQEVVLQGRLDSLKRNPEAVAVEARSLGLYRTGELVAMMGSHLTRSSLFDEGHVISTYTPPKRDDFVFRVISSGVGAIVLILALFARKVRHASGTE
ncbi:MAG: septum formation initiator family protein [Spirochaetales bacterium]|nr:septum formation initiator family protein [Spirochaetales bacterium]